MPGHLELDGVLRATWLATLVLAALALSIALAVVLHRLWQELRQGGASMARRELRRAVLHAVQGDDWRVLLPQLAASSREQLLDLVDELAQVVRGDSRRRLARLATELGLRDQLLAELASWRPGVRARAASRLALFEGTEVEIALLRALEDRASEVRLAAGESLVGRAAAAARLAEVALVDPVFAVPAAARFWHLLALADPATFARCFEAVEDLARLRLVIEAAAQAGRVHLADRIAEFCMAARPELRRTATAALLALRHPLAFPALERMLVDDEAELRAEALVLVGRHRLGRYAAQVLERLDDPEPLVRTRARETALRLGLPLPAAPAAGSGGVTVAS